MTNTNIQGVIPLEGPGLTYRADGDYQRGEYSILRNVELVEKALRLRRPIIPVNDKPTEFTKGDFISKFHSFMGENEGKAFAAGLEKSFFVGGQNRQGDANFDQTLLPTYDAAAVETGANNRMLGFFSYNTRYYWLTLKTFSTATPDELWLYYSNANADLTEGNYSGGLPANSIKIVTLPTENYLVGQVLNLFIHKDRLWVVTQDRIYFSKATDPTIFAVPDGGFVDFEAGNITDCVALGDTIYISTDRKTYVYSYSVDPNEDGYLRPVYEGSKITALCVYNDTVYAASRTSLFQVYGANFEIIKNLTSVFSPDAALTSEAYDIHKLESFGDSIFMLSNAGCFLFNTTNGSISEVYFEDAAGGTIVDLSVPSSVNVQQAAYFAVQYTDGTNNYTRFYFMNESRNDAGYVNLTQDHDTEPISTSGLDRVLASQAAGRTQTKVPIPYNVKINNWAPDGSEYMMKKFRRLLLQGKLPVGEYYITYDDPSAASLNINYIRIGTNLMYPYPYSARLLQRSKMIGLQFVRENAAAYTGYDRDSPHFFLINDLRTYWSYIGNLGSTRTP